MATAAHTSTISHATTLAGTYTAIDGIKSVSEAKSRDELDTTDLADGSWRTFIQGLGGLTLELSGDYEAGSTQQDALFAAIDGGTTVFLQYLRDGTNGFKGEFYVNSANVTGEVAGITQVTFSCRLTGAPTDVP